MIVGIKKNNWANYLQYYWNKAFVEIRFFYIREGFLWIYQ